MRTRLSIIVAVLAACADNCTNAQSQRIARANADAYAPAHRDSGFRVSFPTQESGLRSVAFDPMLRSTQSTEYAYDPTLPFPSSDPDYSQPIDVHPMRPTYFASGGEYTASGHNLSEFDPKNQLPTMYPVVVDQGGPYPYVSGDIFGVSRHECCDEWHGHCRCLELTNWRSRCDCTNPYRAHYGDCATCYSAGSVFSSYRPPASDCRSCSGGLAGGERYPGKTAHAANRTARRSVSDYFHPVR